PVCPMPVFQISSEIQITEPVALPPPHQRPPTYMISPIPVEALYLYVWTFLFVDPKVKILFIQRIVPFQHRVIFDHLLCASTPMREFPGMFSGRRVIFHMFYVATAFQHYGL